jgi:hypothetical protein
MAHGRSFAEVEAMTMAEVGLIYDYWKDYPPDNEILSAVHGVGIFGKDASSDDAPVATVDPKTLEELRQSLARNAHLLAR